MSEVESFAKRQRGRRLSESGDRLLIASAFCLTIGVVGEWFALFVWLSEPGWLPSDPAILKSQITWAPAIILYTVSRIQTWRAWR